VSLKHKLLRLLAGLTLYGGLLIGVPMPPDSVEELLRQMRQPKVVQTLRKQDDKRK
jgi:hypothetical protein